MRLKIYGFKEEKHQVREMTIAELKVGLFEENYVSGGFTEFRLVDLGECETHVFNSVTELMLWGVNELYKVELFSMSQVESSLHVIFRIVKEEK